MTGLGLELEPNWQKSHVPSEKEAPSWPAEGNERADVLVRYARMKAVSFGDFGSVLFPSGPLGDWESEDLEREVCFSLPIMDQEDLVINSEALLRELTEDAGRSNTVRD